MSVETLRRAASLMRERAVDAFHDNSRDLWTDMAAIDPDNNGWIVCERRQPDVDWDTTVASLPYDYKGRVARHIAGMHPVVALALADLLDATAEAEESNHRDLGFSPLDITAEMNVARAYLGESA